jgi:cytochrome c553
MQNTMKYIRPTWFLALILTTSVCLPSFGNAAEVFVSDADAINLQNIHIRQLAASCAACHGTLGNSVSASNEEGANAVLAGMASTEFKDKMLGFKDGTRKATVMHHHAKGLTADEINLLAIHFSQQKRIAKIPLISNILKAEHE